MCVCVCVCICIIHIIIHICRWALRLLPCFGYWKQCRYEHWGLICFLSTVYSHFPERIFKPSTPSSLFSAPASFQSSKDNYLLYIKLRHSLSIAILCLLVSSYSCSFLTSLLPVSEKSWPPPPLFKPNVSLIPPSTKTVTLLPHLLSCIFLSSSLSFLAHWPRHLSIEKPLPDKKELTFTS